MARDTITYEWLKDIGVHDVELVPDTAFILDRADDARIQEILSQEGVPSDRAYIGLNISKLLNHLYRQQLGFITRNSWPNWLRACPNPTEGMLYLSLIRSIRLGLITPTNTT